MITAMRYMYEILALTRIKRVEYFVSILLVISLNSIVGLI